MAATTINAYSDEITANRPPLYAPLKTNRSHGRVRCVSFTLTLASQASGTNFAVAIIPKGARLLSGTLAASATLANSATLSVGLAATDGSGEIKAAAQGTALTTAGASSATAESDAVACLKAAAAQGATQVGFCLTQALGYLYETQKEVYVTLTTGTGAVSTEVVTGHIFYVVD